MAALLVLLAPVVAVLPFEDLGAAGDAHGAGLREAVRTVLEGQLERRVTLAPRAAPEPGLDRARDPEAPLDAQKDPPLDAQKEPDSKRARRLGRALGASHVVVGAFEATPETIKLWARVYDARRGRLLGTATANGPPGELFALAAQVANELARAARFRPAAHADEVERAGRVRSLRVLELWGAALVERDPQAQKHLLQQALDEDPTFAAAARALDELEKRERPAGQASAEESAAREARAELDRVVREEKDAARIYERCVRRLAELQKQRRYRRLIAEAQAMVASPPPPVPELNEQLPEAAQFLIVAAFDRLNDDDGLLREGPRFLARYPLSDNFVAVRQLVDQAFERRKQAREGAARAAGEIAQLPEAARADPCRLGAIYAEHAQLREARRAFHACLATPGPHPDELVRDVWAAYELGEFGDVVLLLERLQRSFPDRFQKLAHLVEELPVD